ncbi:MAG: hypothetical protein ACKVRP_01960 [Bacteroidota bacterium]
MAADELLSVAIGMLLLGGVFWYLLQRQNMLAKARFHRAESINRLIDKFGTAKEVIEFLETEQGEKFLADPAPPGENPRYRALRFIQVGVVFLFVGFGFMMNASLYKNHADVYGSEALEWKFWGTLLCVFGAGLLVVAYLTNAYIKKWGLGREGNGKH